MAKYFTKADMDVLARKYKIITKELKKTICRLSVQNTELRDKNISLRNEIEVLKHPELLDHVTKDYPFLSHSSSLVYRLVSLSI